MNRFPLRTRIAPTPSGLLHMGNIFSFVLTWLIAKSRGGTVRLRIDDLDAARMRPVYLENIFSTLDLIGLVPDEGPSGVEDFLKNHSQLHRLGQYNAIIEQLKQAGHLYACTCSRSKIQAESRDGIYSGACRSRGFSFESESVAWRLKLPVNQQVTIEDAITGVSASINLPGTMGDFVARRKDGVPAYQVASVADDLYYGINLVVRGEDLLASTAAQIQLARMAGIQAFETTGWHHHVLLKNENGQKLSKSAGDRLGNLLPDAGIKKSVIFTNLAPLLGLKKRNYDSLDDLLDEWTDYGVLRK